MSKTLEQIQEENRKAIIDANGGDLAIDGPYEYIENGKSTGYIRKIERGYKIVSCHLAQVLIAVRKLNPNISFVGGDYTNEMFFKDWDNEESSEVDWDLTKPTLEEQTEETQLSIAKLLGYDKQ